MFWSSSSQKNPENDQKIYMAGGAFVLALLLFVCGYFLTAKVMNSGGGGSGQLPPGSSPNAIFSADAKLPAVGAPIPPPVAQDLSPNAGGQTEDQQALAAKAQQAQLENETNQRRLIEQNERKQRDARRQSALRSAKKMIDKGQGQKARGKLEELVRDFPGSPEAEEAARLLEALSKK
jgi:hypothetical protein